MSVISPHHHDTHDAHKHPLTRYNIIRPVACILDLGGKFCMFPIVHSVTEASDAGTRPHIPLHSLRSETPDLANLFHLFLHSLYALQVPRLGVQLQNN